MTKFSDITHPLHDKNDNDCICPGCMRVLAEIAREIIKSRMKEGSRYASR